MMRDDTDALRARLTALHHSMLQQLAEADVIDGGLLRLASDAGAALAAIGADAAANVPHRNQAAASY